MRRVVYGGVESHDRDRIRKALPDYCGQDTRKDRQG